MARVTDWATDRQLAGRHPVTARPVTIPQPASDPSARSAGDLSRPPGHLQRGRTTGETPSDAQPGVVNFATERARAASGPSVPRLAIATPPAPPPTTSIDNLSMDVAPNVGRHTPAGCWCGAALPVRTRCATCGRASGGPRRISHDVACRRRRDRLVRQWQRRHEWLDAWRAELGCGAYSDERVRAEIEQLRAELDALERELGRGLYGVRQG